MAASSVEDLWKCYKGITLRTEKRSSHNEDLAGLFLKRDFNSSENLLPGKHDTWATMDTAYLDSALELWDSLPF